MSGRDAAAPTAARRAAGSVAVLGAVLLVVACTAAPAGPAAGEPATPVPAPAAPPSRDAPPGGAVPGGPGPPVAVPRVTAPRDPARLAGCHPSTEVLGPGLVDASTAEPVTGVAGSGCTWAGPARAFLLRADVRTGGIEETYRARELLRAFRTGELDGYPTVVTTPEGDPSCALRVATSDHDTVTVQAAPAGVAVADPCATAARAASRLLAALPP